MRGDLQDDLAAYWRLEEASGSRADSGPNGLTLTDNNTVTQGTGKVGSCASFAAASFEFLHFVNTAPLQMGSTDHTFSLWCKFTTLPTGAASMILISKWTAFDTDAEYIISATHDGGSDVHFQWMTTESGDVDTDNNYVVGGTVLTTATWYHLIAIQQGSVKSLYVNGVLDNANYYVDFALWPSPESPPAMPGAHSGSADFKLGGLSGGYMNGLIDEVGVWRVALGSVAISDLYNSGDGLVWPLRDGPPTFRRTRGLR